MQEQPVSSFAGIGDEEGLEGAHQVAVAFTLMGL
jgi:hypothetical protein